MRSDNIRKIKSPLRRFMMRVSPQPNGCVLWTGGDNGKYGSMRANGRRVSTHVFSYKAFVGEVSPGDVVRHSCDTPLCVNPDHLLLGTQKDNIHDMWERGRQSPPPLNKEYLEGETHHWKFFPDELIREIKRRLAEGESRRAISEKCGVSYGHVGQIARGDRCAHI